MRLKKGHFLGKVIFTLLFGLIFLSISHLFVFAASSPMNLNLEKSIQIALESNMQISLNDLEKEKQAIIYKVTEAYYQVLQTEGIKRVSGQAVKQMQAHLESSEALLKEGMIAPIDLNRIKSQLSNLEHNLIKAENGHKLMMYNLNSIMGIDLNIELLLENNLSYEPCEINLEQALIQARENRLEIMNIIKNSQESFRVAQVKYNEGIATNTEVIDAQGTLIEAETNHLNALYDYNINHAALVKAMGIYN